MKFDDGCGRYGLAADSKDLKERYNLDEVPPEFPISYNVSPGQILPVIVEAEAGKLRAEMMKWGLVPFWSKSLKTGLTLFNARDDKLFESNLWKPLVLKKRALIPATGYFEWTKPPKGTPKQKFYFHPKQLDIFSFAGVWSSWKDVEGKEFKTYSIITTEPNKEARQVHNRMPVILHPEDEPKWLESSKTSEEDILPFLHPLEDDGLEVREVSYKTKDFAYDDEGLITPLNSK